MSYPGLFLAVLGSIAARLAVLVVSLTIGAACYAEEKVSLVLSDVRLVELAGLTFGDIAGEPYVFGHELLEGQQLYSVNLRNVSKAQAVAAVSALVQSAGLDVVRRSGVVWIGKAAEVAEEVIVYRPRHRSARYLADVVQSVTGARSLLARGVSNKGAQLGARAGDEMGGGLARPRADARQAGPMSAEGQIDRSEVDQIAFNVAGKDAAKVRKLLADLDTPSGEVMLKAAVYEVGVERREGSAVQIAASLMAGKLSGTIAGNILGGVSIKVAQGGIEAVLSALDADVRFKSVSRPQVRVRNGAQARFSVGQDVPVLGVAQLDKNGNPIQSVDYKQSGVILTATPEIREDVIELALQQELSNFVVTKTGVNGSPTLIKRAVNTKLGLVPGEVVVLAGLQDDQQDESQNRLPLFGWLLGDERQDKRSEILVFIEVHKL